MARHAVSMTAQQKSRFCKSLSYIPPQIGVGQFPHFQGVKMPDSVPELIGWTPRENGLGSGVWGVGCTGDGEARGVDQRAAEEEVLEEPRVHHRHHLPSDACFIWCSSLVFYFRV